MELRFDLEARAAEAERLRRRATELQAAVRVRGAGDSSGGAKGAAALRPPGGRFKRERCVFGVDVVVIGFLVAFSAAAAAAAVFVGCFRVTFLCILTSVECLLCP